MQILCEFCNDPVNPQEPGTHQFTLGWVKNRAGGGGHAVALPKREPRWAHNWCIKKAAAGTIGQGSLLDDPNAKPPVIEPGPTNASFDENGMLLHVCNVCGGPAPYGIGVALHHGALGLWYCAAHLPKVDDDAA